MPETFDPPTSAGPPAQPDAPQHPASDATGADPGRVQSGAARKGLPKGAQISIGALAIALLLGWYGSTQLTDGLSFQYFQNLEDFHASTQQMVGRSARVHGYVANASIERDLEAKIVRFDVQNDPPHKGGPPGKTLSVVYTSLETPDLFKDGAEVVVEGYLLVSNGEPVFEANNVLAKCPSKFEAKAGPASEPSIEL